MMAYNRNNYDRSNETIEVEIVKQLGDLALLQSGWIKEVNIVSWNGNPPKIDIREWSPDHDKMSRGITLFEDEAKKLMECLEKYFTKGKGSQVKVKVRGEDKNDEAVPVEKSPEEKKQEEKSSEEKKQEEKSPEEKKLDEAV